MNKWARKRRRLEEQGKPAPQYYTVHLPLDLWKAVSSHLPRRTVGQWLRFVILAADGQGSAEYRLGKRPNGSLAPGSTHRAKVQMTQAEAEQIRLRQGNFTAFAVWAVRKQAQDNGWIYDPQTDPATTLSDTPLRRRWVALGRPGPGFIQWAQGQGWQRQGKGNKSLWHKEDKSCQQADQ